MTVKKGILEHQKGRKRPRKSVRERIKPDLGESCWNLLGQWRPLLAHFWFLCRLEMRTMMTYSRSRRKKEKSKVKSGPRQLLQTCAPACFQQSSRPGSLRPSTLTSATHVLWLLTASICHLHLDARPTHQTLPIASAVYLALTPAWVLDEEGDTARPSHRAKARTLRREPGFSSGKPSPGVGLVLLKRTLCCPLTAMPVTPGPPVVISVPSGSFTLRLGRPWLPAQALSVGGSSDCGLAGYFLM